MLRVVQPGESAAPEAEPGNIPQQLRRIATDIESGSVVGAQTAVVILKSTGTNLMVYGIQPGDEKARLNAAYMLLSLALRELERVAVQADSA